MLVQKNICQKIEKQKLKRQCPDCAHARAPSGFSSKDNRTVILTGQDFLPDHTADGDLLFTFSSNILDCERFEPRSHFKRLSFIVRVNVVLKRTVVVDSD